MSTTVEYICPTCREAITDDDVRCGGCGATWPSVTVGGTRVVDFLGRPPAEGGVDLGQLRAPPAGLGRPFHHKSKVLRGFLDWRDRLILDAGCREAPIGHLLATGNHLVGVDISAAKMLTAEPNALDKGYRALLLADAHDLPLADGQFDLVLATDLLEHVVFPEQLLAEFRRVLKAGGQVLITTPNLVSYNNRLSILVGSGVGIEMHGLLKLRSPVNPIAGARYPDQKLHLRFFTRPSLVGLVRQAGFRVLRSFGYDPVLSRLPGADRLLRNLCSLVVVLAEKP